MKPYPSYRKSDVEWMLDIPSGWTPTKNKFLFKIQKKLVGERSNYYQLLSLTKKGIITRDIESGKGKFPEKFDTYQAVKKDNLVFCLFDIDETPRTIGLSTYDGMITGAYTVVQCNEGVDPKFIYYNYLSIDDVKGLRPFYTGLRKVVRTETFLGLKVQTPSYQEQQQISKFLDHKTQQIDSLIEITQQKTELLKEQRTSLINHVVTKGLNPDVEMKDSGVEWIGEIPIEWDVVKIKYLFKSTGGGTPSTDNNDYWNGDIPWVSPKDMKKQWIMETRDYITDLGLQNSSTNLIGVGTLIIVFRSGILKHSIPSSINLVPVTLNQDMKSFLPIDERMTTKFFKYFISGNQENLLLDWSKQGATVESLETDFVENFHLPTPSVDEQQQIVAYLDKETTKIDSLVEKETQRIDLLKEYRQSLISEVVTGKVDVHDEVIA